MVKPRMPLLRALAAQIAAGAVVFGAAFGLAAGTGLRPPLMALLALQGIGAAFLGVRFGLAKWWIPIQLVLPPALAAAWLWKVPEWIFLALFVLLVLVFWNSARGGVPLYLSNPRTRAALAELLPEQQEAGRTGGPTGTQIEFKFADLGCGLGGPVLDLARRRPEGQFTGIESAPLPFVLAWLRLRFAGLANVTLMFGDYRSHGLGEYDVVYAFLSPVPMPDLFDKAKHEMKSGALLISNTFDVPGHQADETVDVADRRQTRLYLWRM